MLAEFRRSDQGDDAPVVATATWDGRAVAIDTEDPELRERLTHAFRPTPVVTDDAAYRRQGTTGEVVLPPGDLTWFRAAAQVRVPAETGLAARWVPGVTSGGFDPAAGYRPFEEQIDRLTMGTAG
jgi:hypothetical protein